MAVDRQAVAWINFNDGKIFKVDTTQTSLPCTATTFTEGSSGFTPQLGMGFATVSATDDSETLYVSDNGGPGGTCTSTTPGAGCMGLGLGSVTSTLTLMPIGPYTDAAGYNAELSGTGDGILYGFFTTTPSELGTIDKASGAVTNIIPLPAVNNSVGGYAFSFWGGDFWIYTAFPTDANPNATTSVTHFVSAPRAPAWSWPTSGLRSSARDPRPACRPCQYSELRAAPTNRRPPLDGAVRHERLSCGLVDPRGVLQRLHGCCVRDHCWHRGPLCRRRRCFGKHVLGEPGRWQHHERWDRLWDERRRQRDLQRNDE